MDNPQMAVLECEWPVEGMSCASCASQVEQTLKSQPGIQEAQVNLATHTVRIFYHEHAHPEQWALALNQVGYKLKAEQNSQSSFSDHNKTETAYYRKESFLALGISAIVMTLSMLFMHETWSLWIQAMLCLFVLLYSGRSIHQKAWKQWINKFPGMDVLVSSASWIATIFSFTVVLFPAWWHFHDKETPYFFEAPAVVIAFVLLGRFLEARSRQGTGDAVEKLIGMQVKEVEVVQDNGQTLLTAIEKIQPKQKIIIRAGQRVPLDGQVATGEGAIDNSMWTGESLPIEVKPGDFIRSGAMCIQGSIFLEVTQTEKDSSLNRLVERIRTAQASKSPIQQKVDKISARFIPFVALIGMLSFLVWWLVGGEDGLRQGIISLVSVWVMACPCALGLATPLAIVAAVGKGAKHGILLKDAATLAHLPEVKHVMFDKTGTLTFGKPIVFREHWIEQKSQYTSLLQAISAQSDHPLSKAVALHLLQNIDPTFLPQYTETVKGMGLWARFEDKVYLLGNQKLMQLQGIYLPENLELESDSSSLVFFSNEKTLIAYFELKDEIRPESQEIVQHLIKSGIHVWMLTGDRQEVASEVANSCGIPLTNVRAELSPEEKQKQCEFLASKGVSMMVGDGLNDTAAMASAQISVAMQQGHDLVLDSASVVFNRSDLYGLNVLLQLATDTKKIIRQNLTWALIYNALGIPLAAGILIPYFGFSLPPEFAAAAMAFSSFSVVINSLRLQKKE